MWLRSGHLFCLYFRRTNGTKVFSCSFYVFLDSSFWGFVLSLIALAQQAPPPAAAVDDDFIQKQFGSTCKLMPGPLPMKADLNGDGIEDLVVAARCTNPLGDQAEDNFTVIDPYNHFFGYGSPKVTSQFASEDPATRGLVLLVIHGAGTKPGGRLCPRRNS